MTLLPLALLITGCTPQDAELSANYAIYLAEASSENINNLVRKGTDVEGQPGKLGLTPIDCRALSVSMNEEEVAAARLQGVDYAAECCESGSGEDCTDVKQPRYFGWLDDYAYYLTEGQVEPWRSEAVITSEGDFQLTVHMDFPELGDFRFGWVIDPNFQPVECRDGEGGAELIETDGNWLENWSAGEEKGTLWHLNSGGYQINPSNNGVAWYFEKEWMAGYTFARFGDEEFYGRATDYNDEEYRPFYVNTYAEDGSCEDTDDRGNAVDNDGDGLANDEDPDCEFGFEGTSIPTPRAVDPNEAYGNWVESNEEWFANLTDLSDLGKSSFPVKMKIEDNSWRPSDDVASGLDGWLGVSSSWVRIDNPEAIEVGSSTPVTGEFQIYLEGVAAASKVIVGGTFTINNIREDVWGYNKDGMTTLDEIKRAENNTPTCGEERTTLEE